MVMLESRPIEGSALLSTKTFDGGNKHAKNQKHQANKRSNKGSLWCTYYKKPWHTRETYFKLHGKEQVLSRMGGFKGQRSKAHLANQDGGSQEVLISIDNEVRTLITKKLKSCEVYSNPFLNLLVHAHLFKVVSALFLILLMP